MTPVSNSNQSHARDVAVQSTHQTQQTKPGNRPHIAPELSATISQLHPWGDCDPQNIVSIGKGVAC